MRTWMGAAAVGMAGLVLNGLAEAPSISGEKVRQRWPWSRLVDIDYVLNCDQDAVMDVLVEAYDGAKRLAVSSSSFSGDLLNVRRGPHRIVWDPTATSCATNGILTQFRVSLTPIPSPLYMIVDLTKAAGEEGQLGYVTEEALTNGEWGAWVRNPITNASGQAIVESVIWTGVTTNDLYKTDRLVLRRIRAGTFKMGFPPTTTTTLTKDFYAGVFEVTQRQWEWVAGSNPSDFTNPEYNAGRPVEKVSYNMIRGATNSTTTPVNWPLTDRSVVAPDSFLWKLRQKTGLYDFDLPTEAQWEYLCRAGTTNCFNDGNAAADVVEPNKNTNIWLNALGRYRYNGGYFNGGATAPTASTCGPENGTAIVGSYRPNAWGLYDTHANVWEWCLDWYSTLQGGDDPKGKTSGTVRIFRGGSWNGAAELSPSGKRATRDPANNVNSFGFRLVLTLP